MADQLLKPEELVMYRPAIHGGLGVLHVKVKAMAGLSKTFLEKAGHEKFRTSQYHSMLYRLHVLGDISVPDPGIPPFYSRDFFTTIQKVSNTSTRNIFSMTEREWYNCVMEDSYTMEVGVSGRQEYVQCRVERMSPETDWGNVWRLAVLSTQERVSRTKPNLSSS